MFYARAKTNTEYLFRETYSFDEAWAFLNDITISRNDIQEAIVIEDNSLIEKDNYYFNDKGIIASMRIIK